MNKNAVNRILTRMATAMKKDRCIINHNITVKKK